MCTSRDIPACCGPYSIDQALDHCLSGFREPHTPALNGDKSKTPKFIDTFAIGLVAGSIVHNDLGYAIAALKLMVNRKRRTRPSPCR